MKVMSVRLPEELVAALDEYGAAHRWSRNTVIREFCEQGLGIASVPEQYMNPSANVMAEGASLKAVEGPKDPKPPTCEHPRTRQHKLAHNRWRCECGAILQTNGRVIRP